MKELQESTPQGWVRFAVCLRESDAVIGFVGIDDIDCRYRTAESDSEMIDSAYRGSGFGSEAKHLMFDYAFNTLGLHMLQSWALFDNTRSAAALRKRGYTEAGRVHWIVRPSQRNVHQHRGVLPALGRLAIDAQAPTGSYGMTTETEQTNPELTSAAGQTYLVGEEIYLRPVVPSDAEYVNAWKGSPFPMAPERAREWITEDLAKSSDPYKVATYLVVRRSDERPVGSLTIDSRHFPQHFVNIEMDPLLGEQRLRWKSEALLLVLRWLIDEQQRPKASLFVPADETPVIEALEGIGARVTTCFRERIAGPGGARRDEMVVEYLNRDWIARLGDPAGVEIPRTGTGQPRPMVPALVPEGDPPANAMRIGQRVYLRPPQESDARAIALWSLRETDVSWDNGRHPLGANTAADWITSWQKKTPPNSIDLAVCLRETDEFIGLVGLMDINWQHRFGESVSMMMNPAYREAGYASEAKHLMFEHVFNTLDIHAIQSWVMFDNPRSAAALRKQGYREAGREHWIGFRDGRFVNFVAFDLLASDWRAMPRMETE